MIAVIDLYEGRSRTDATIFRKSEIFLEIIECRIY